MNLRCAVFIVQWIILKKLMEHKFSKRSAVVECWFSQRWANCQKFCKLFCPLSRSDYAIIWTWLYWQDAEVIFRSYLARAMFWKRPNLLRLHGLQKYLQRYSTLYTSCDVCSNFTLKIYFRIN